MGAFGGELCASGRAGIIVFSGCAGGGPDNWHRGKLSDNGRLRQARKDMRGVRARETRSSGL